MTGTTGATPPATPAITGRRESRSVHLSTSGELARIVPDEHSGYVLEIGGQIQSHVDPERPTDIRYEYLRRMAHVLDAVAPAGQPLTCLHLGAGALSLPRYVQATRPGSEQTVVDLDHELVQFVTGALPLPQGAVLRSVVGDARAVVGELAGERFDVVVLDIDTGAEVAAHLREASFHGELLGLLTGRGVLVVNVGDDDGLATVAQQVAALGEAAGACGVAAPLVLADATMLERLELGNVVLAAGPGLDHGGRWGEPASLLAHLRAGGPHPAAVLTGDEARRWAHGIEQG